jgi:hypothetical protein
MRVRRHRSAVGVSERDLALPSPVQFRQHVLVPLPPLLDCGDLLGQVFDARAVLPAFGGVALIEALKIVVELGVSGFDVLGQGRSREITIFVVDCLDPGAIYREQLPAKQVQLATEQNKFTEHLADSEEIPKTGLALGAIVTDGPGK